LSASADYLYVGKCFDTSVERDLNAYSLFNLSGSYRATKTFTYFARVQNLFNSHYEEAGGYGTPGVSFYGGVKVSF